MIFGSQAEQKKIRLEKVVSMDHPTRLGDPLRFRKVLFNLVSNAIKFTDEGGQVLLRMSDDGELIHTEVEDTGAGIPKEHLSTLFEVHLYHHTPS
jgi:two-component system aerobic respiration control sensor histidine kinase ArcB